LARIVFNSDLRRYTNGEREVEIDAGNYQELTRQLSHRFPALTDAVLAKYTVAIDGVIIQMPMLEKINSGGEVVFVARIAGG
jgi:molybdopterin converting factor small subunit